MKNWMIAAAIIVAPCVWAADAPPAAPAPAAPDVNAVIEQMAAVGPGALLARVKELKAAEADLQNQAKALRQQADQKDAEAVALKARIEAVEKFTADLAAMSAPPPAAPAAPATPAAAPAPAPAPAPAAAAPAMTAAAPPAAAAPAEAAAAPAAPK